MIALAVWTALLLQAAPSVPVTAPEVAPTPPAKAKVVCRKEVPTGSVMAKKVCLNEKQITAREQGARKDREKLRDMRNNRPSVSQF